MLKSKIPLILIIVLAAVLRFYNLGKTPPGLDWDETAHGYNAYSILKTGRDEYGYKFPLSFRSFDDYKPPLYTYLVVPSVAAFGLNDFAVRFPSAALGTLAVLFTYLMVNALFKRKDIALLSALFLAISPWHVQFSRVAFETNTSVMWTTLGTWAFLKGTGQKGKHLAIWMSLSALAFGADLFTYHNVRVFIPIYSSLLIFLNRKNLFQNKKYLVIPLIITTVFIGALIPILFSVSGQLRFKGTTIFADLSPKYVASEEAKQDSDTNLAILGKIFHNRRMVYVPIIVDNYLSNFRLNYLFFTADMDRHHAPEVGLLYLWDLPFIISGMYFLAKKDFEVKSKLIIFWWFLIAPIAASVTWGVPHSLRSEIYLPTYQIFAAIGVITFLSFHKNKTMSAVVFAALFLNFVYYLHQYYYLLPKEYSQAWLYGRKEAALYTDSVKNNYDKIIVSTKLEQPHEFWLYYLKYDPKKYQQEGGTVSGGFLEERNKFDKYQFRPVNFSTQSKEPKTLFVGTPEEFPKGIKTVKTINYLNGEPAIYIVKNE